MNYHPGNCVYKRICHGCGSCDNRGECYACVYTCCGSRINEAGCTSVPSTTIIANSSGPNNPSLFSIGQQHMNNRNQNNCNQQ